jgi:hypothetical protein
MWTTTWRELSPFSNAAGPSNVNNGQWFMGGVNPIRSRSR